MGRDRSPVWVLVLLCLLTGLVGTAHAGALGVTFVQPNNGATVSDTTGVAIIAAAFGGPDADGDGIVDRHFVFSLGATTLADFTTRVPLNHQEGGFLWSLVGVADGTYVIQVTVFDELGESATSSLTIHVANAGTAQLVVWQNPVHVAVDGNTIVKNAGCDGCSDAGAVSQQTIASGDGAVEFTVSPNAYLTVGLGAGNPATTFNDIAFALRFYPGNVVQVRENGVFKADWTYPAGATHRIAVDGGVVKYSVNGVVQYTSTQPPVYPLVLDTSLWTLGAAVQNATISTGSVGGGDTTPPTVAVTAPAAATTVSGAVTLSAAANDTGGVASVQFKVDGVNVGSADTTAPYSVTWDTSAAANGPHSITAIATDAAGNTTASAPVMVTVSNGGSGPGSGAQPVVWTSLVNATASGNTATKSGGCDGCFDAGAVSVQAISSGNGSVSFTTPANAFLVVGLDGGNPGTGGNEITFGLRFYPGSPGIVEVREGGAYKWDWLNAPGAIHTIAVEAGVVKYFQNGVLKYTSAIAPTLPLQLDTALGSAGSAVQDAMISP